MFKKVGKYSRGGASKAPPPGLDSCFQFFNVGWYVSLYLVAFFPLRETPIRRELLFSAEFSWLSPSRQLGGFSTFDPLSFHWERS